MPKNVVTMVHRPTTNMYTANTVLHLSTNNLIYVKHPLGLLQSPLVV